MERNLYALQMPEAKSVMLLGNFDTNSTSAPDGVRGQISVTRSGVGTFAVTLRANSRIPHVAGAGGATFSKQLYQIWAACVGTGGSRVHVKSITTSGGMITGFSVELRRTEVAAWVTGQAVASDTVALPNAGRVVSVQSTAGSSTGPKNIMQGGAPGAGQVRVEYTAGVPTLTFAAGECTTAAYSQDRTETVQDTDNETILVGLVGRNSKLDPR